MVVGSVRGKTVKENKMMSGCYDLGKAEMSRHKGQKNFEMK